MRRAALFLLVSLAAAGCGEAERPASPAPAGGTRLEVTVRPRGPGGPVERKVVTRVPPGTTRADFAPVPGDVACTEIYGGPATARVAGTLSGRRVDAAFRRSNGCEIARWDRLEALLGRVPGPPAAP